MHDRTTQALLDRARQQAEAIRAAWGPGRRACETPEKTEMHRPGKAR